MDIIGLAFKLTEAVDALKAKVRRLYYAVMLMGHICPTCDGALTMASGGRCCCRDCSHEFDPTVLFQRCQACGGVPELCKRRYRCRECGSDISSRFLFDGLVFNTEYFRQSMAKSRRRRKEQRERVRTMLAESRSSVLEMPAADGLEAIPGLVDALSGLTDTSEPKSLAAPQEGFDLRRYQSHIQAHIPDFPISLVAIPPLGENTRKDLIWRFIATLFMAHFGLIDIWQNGRDIMVIKRETDTEGQSIPGDLEGVDGIEGSLGGIEA